MGHTIGAMASVQCWRSLRQYPCSFEVAVKELARWTYKFEVLGDVFVKVTKAEDIRRAKREGKLGYFFGFQESGHIGSDVNLLDYFYYLGLRQCDLGGEMRYTVGDAASGERGDGGLSNFGFEVVDRMNKLGMVIDLTHSSRRTAENAIEVSKDPVIFSHVNCRALCDHVLNRTDEEIKAMAEAGGIIGLTMMAHYLTEKETATLGDFSITSTMLLT